jgi:hypothetical protein
VRAGTNGIAKCGNTNVSYRTKLYDQTAFLRLTFHFSRERSARCTTTGFRGLEIPAP